MMTLVAALTKDRVIGNQGTLPWSIPEELDVFKSITQGHPVIMGRKTFESIGKPLSDRTNIILSRNKMDIPGTIVCNDVNEAVRRVKGDAFVIGGAEVFAQTIGLADRMLLSRIKGTFNGDKLFPEFSHQDWRLERIEDHPEFEFLEYLRQR